MFKDPNVRGAKCLGSQMSRTQKMSGDPNDRETKYPGIQMTVACFFVITTLKDYFHYFCYTAHCAAKQAP